MSPVALSWYPLSSLLISSLLPSTLPIPRPSQAEAISRAKQATVLVEVLPSGDSGSAFSIGGGYLVTCEHVVSEAPPSKPLRVVVNSGEKNQRILAARVVRADKNSDLALLRVDPSAAPPILKLADAATLVETMPIMVFGFPFGSFLSEKEGEFPNVTVTTGRITSLRKTSGELTRIQLDASVNPGASGGPVVDQKGEVVGVVEAVLSGTDLNFGVPVNRLRTFLARPDIVVTTPKVEGGRITGPLSFTIDVTSFLGSDSEPTVTLSVSMDGNTSRTYPASRNGSGRFTVNVESGGTSKGMVTLEASDGAKVTTITAKDVPIKVGTQSVGLSDIKSVERARANAVRVTLRNGTTATVPAARFAAVAAEVGGVPATLDLSHFASIQISNESSAARSIDYTITVKSGNKTIGEQSGSLSSGSSSTPSGQTAPPPVGAGYVRFQTNGHWYCAVRLDRPMSWPDAKKAAEAMKYMGMKGHLATLTTAEEADFVALNFPGDSQTSYWLGGYQDRSAPDFMEPRGGWRWVTGEPWNYTNWRRGEPNDPGGMADFTNTFPDGSWNDTIATDDHGRAYIVEFE